MTTIQAIALAHKWMLNGAAMQSSAVLCHEDACAAKRRGDNRAAQMWAKHSLSYSVGVFHADYQAVSTALAEVK